MSIVFAADGTKPMDQEWAATGTSSHCAQPTFAGETDPNVFQVADVTAAHGRAYRSQFTSADNSASGCFTTNLRAELQMGNPSKTFSNGIDHTFHEGQDRWISCQIKLDANLPTYAQGFKGSSLLQFHPAQNDGGMFNLNASFTASAIQNQWDIWGYTNTSAGNGPRYDHALGDLLSCRGKWVKFTFHMNFSSTSSSAFSEVYSDLANPGGFSTIPLLWRRDGPNMKSGRAYHFLTFGFYAYRPIPAGGIGASCCGMTVATDRASAETNAFGTYIPPSGNPPVASFTTSPSPATTGIPVTFDASASTSSSPPLAYAWTDANGGASLGSSKIQPFTFQVVGTKLVTLTVADTNGTASIEHDLIVNASNPTAPVAAFTATPSAATVGQTVTLDATASTGTAPLTYAWVSDGAFNLGTLMVQPYAFVTAATKHVVLTVTDANGTTASIEHDLVVTAGTPPVAAFTASPSPAVTGQVVTFDASASTVTTPPLTYSWMDGTSSLGTNQVQTFTFQGAGTKRPTLTVTDGAGRTSSVEHDLVVTAATGTTFPSGDLRSQQTLAVGNDYFAKVIVRLPSNLPTTGLTAFRFASIDGPPTTTGPPLALGVTVSGGAIHWCLQRGADYSNDIVWIGPVVDNAWHKFILHVNMDTAAAGTGYVAAMTSAVNYWLANGTNLAGATWQNAAFHNGNLAYLATPGATPNTATDTWAANNAYTIGNTVGTARPDDLAAGEVFLKLGQPASIRARVTGEVAAGDHTIWTFIDALNMAMPSYARLGILDASAADLSALHAQFTYTESTLGLWNDTVGLWWRDGTYTTGSIYWSRGNGWAMIGLAKILQILPSSDPGYAEYLRVFQKMAATLIPRQLSNGFWGSDLTNPSAYGNEESGTAFFTYAIAWGVNAGILDLITYLPVLTKAWTALSTVALQPSGAVGYVQGATSGAQRPSDGQPVLVTDTSAYGVGGFLRAASELAKLPGGTGYIELWLDGTKQTFTTSVQTLPMTTYGSDNNGGANWLDIQSYRNSGWLTTYVQGAGQGGTSTPGTLRIYYAQPEIGPTLTSVA